MVMLMSEFKRLAEPLFKCQECGRDINGLIFQSIGNVILYQHGYTPRKKFDEQKFCPECFAKKYPDLMSAKEGEDSVHKYFLEKQQEAYNNLSPEEKQNYEDKKKWTKEQNERKDVLILNSNELGRKHYIDKYTYVTDEYLSVILSSAFESGIYGAGIWGRIVDKKRPVKLDFRQDMEHIYPHIDYIINGGSITLWTFEEDDVEEDPEKGVEQYSKNCLYELTLDKLIQGFTKAYEYWNDNNKDDYKHRCLKDQDDCDSELADCIIQFAIFGDITYC